MRMPMVPLRRRSDEWSDQLFEQSAIIVDAITNPANADRLGIMVLRAAMAVEVIAAQMAGPRPDSPWRPAPFTQADVDMRPPSC